MYMTKKLQMIFFYKFVSCFNSVKKSQDFQFNINTSTGNAEKALSKLFFLKKVLFLTESVNFSNSQ